jgi:ATP:cob(I)alamin adenosyltransferase
MSIVTKKGDKGRTSLFLGGCVAKDSPIMELEGALDELCSFLGLSKSLIKDRTKKKALESIQEDLFVIGAEVATAPRFLKRLKIKIEKNDVGRLEKIIDGLEAKRTLKECCFCLPGKNLTSSALDISRTIARRSERRAVSLTKKKLLKNPYILVYLNRLSDLLYLLARSEE